jgi:hypothetical protein
MEKACNICRYSRLLRIPKDTVKPEDFDGLWECHRNAPRAAIGQQMLLGINTLWPVVRSDDWCGEFKMWSKEEMMGVVNALSGDSK